jgi:hypothetical protein
VEPPEVVPTACSPADERDTAGQAGAAFHEREEGDIILSPGTFGLIAGARRGHAAATLLAPGIMTRTATNHALDGGRPLMGDFAGIDGIRPDVLKYSGRVSPSQLKRP